MTTNRINISRAPARLLPPSDGLDLWITTGTGAAVRMTPDEWEARLAARLPDRGEPDAWCLGADAYPASDEEIAADYRLHLEGL